MNSIRKINIEVTNMEGWREEKAKRSATMVLDFFNSKYFKRKILDARFPMLGESDDSLSNSYSGIDLYNEIMKAHELDGSGKDNEIDLIITWYKKIWSRVVGYVKRGSPVLYVNGKFFDKNTEVSIASNMAHEWMHLIGFFHTDKNGNKEDSIAYLTGMWLKDFYAQKIIPFSKREIKYVYKRVWYKLFIGKAKFLVVSTVS